MTRHAPRRYGEIGEKVVFSGHFPLPSQSTGGKVRTVTEVLGCNRFGERMGGSVSGQDPDSDHLLTPSEVAALFRVDPKTVTRWAKAGKLTSIRTLGGHRRYRASEVHALLEAQSPAQHTSTSPAMHQSSSPSSPNVAPGHYPQR